MPLTLEQKLLKIKNPEFLKRIESGIITVSTTVSNQSQGSFTAKQHAKRKLTANNILEFPKSKTLVVANLLLDYDNNIDIEKSQSVVNAAITNIYNKLSGVLTSELPLT